MSTSLSRDVILATSDYQTRDVDVPEWGGKVWIRNMTAGQSNQFRATCMIAMGGRTPQNGAIPVIDDPQMLFDVFVSAVLWCVCDESGKPLFSESDRSAVSSKSPEVIDRLVDEILDLSGLDLTVSAEKKDFGPTQNGNTGTN